MKANIHPEWYPEAKVTCVCGNKFTLGSTKPEIQVDICSACHPFFTGQTRFVDTMGIVEKFQARQKLAQGKQYVSKRNRRLQKKSKEDEEDSKRPKTFKELLRKS